MFLPSSSPLSSSLPTSLPTQHHVIYLFLSQRKWTNQNKIPPRKIVKSKQNKRPQKLNHHHQPMELALCWLIIPVYTLPVLVVVGKLSWTLLDKTDFSLLSRCQLQIISFLGMEFVSMSPSQAWDFVWFESVQTEFFDMGWWGIGQWI